MSINRINSFRLFEVSSDIVEWDIRRAGLNLIKENSLLSDKKIGELSQLEKEECDKTIGKLQIKDKEFSKNLEQAFTDIMNLFIKENDLDAEYDVLAIKKDACFVINKKISKCTFGDHIRFVPKNKYHAYLYLKPFEFYFRRDGSIDLKGLCRDKKERSRIMKLHEDGILNLIQNVICVAEATQMNQAKINQLLHSFVDMYKKRELDFDYYREFTIQSEFRYQFMGAEIMAQNIDEAMFEKVNIEWNYKNIILPLINILC